MYELEIPEVADPFDEPGRIRKRHTATWRFYDAGDNRTALCGAPLNGRVIDAAEMASVPQCMRCREIRLGLQAQGLVRRHGLYSDYLSGRL